MLVRSAGVGSHIRARPRDRSGPFTRRCAATCDRVTRLRLLKARGPGVLARALAHPGGSSTRGGTFTPAPARASPYEREARASRRKPVRRAPGLRAFSFAALLLPRAVVWLGSSPRSKAATSSVGARTNGPCRQ